MRGRENLLRKGFSLPRTPTLSKPVCDSKNEKPIFDIHASWMPS
jgi:hypothetical protein